MTPDEMLEDALGLMDEDDPRRLAAMRDPDLAERLQRLRRGLDLLLDDGGGPEPPRGLAGRTVQFVESYRRRSILREMVPARVPFRLADLAVAAGIFIAGLLTLLPAVQRSHLAARTAACASNLRQIGMALIRYATDQRTFPYVTAADSPAPYAGSFLAHLYGAGYLHEPSLMDCPTTADRTWPSTVPCFSDLCEEVRRSGLATPLFRSNDYAYNLGYRQGNALRPLPISLSETLPLLADKPPHDGLGRAMRMGNSPNHGGRGQNVFFSDGHLRFLPSRRLGLDRDVFRNDEDRTAPGLHMHDYVLGASCARFDGVPE